MNTPIIKHYGRIPPNKAEILRYSGAKKGDKATELLIDECLKTAEETSANKVIYMRVSVKLTPNGVEICEREFVSQSLRKFVGDCNEVIVFAATVGIGIDRLTEKYKTSSVTKAVVFDAIGSDRIEGLCDEFCREVGCSARFSPGYGDLDVAYQRDIFRILGACDKIGLVLNDSMLMSPSKSVTAIARIGSAPCKQNKCLSCDNETCIYKR